MTVTGNCHSYQRSPGSAELYGPTHCTPRLLRYPGGKGRLLPFLRHFLPKRQMHQGRYIDPFVGGGAVFFYQRPRHALLSDINPELMDLYETIRNYPVETWEKYCEMPGDKDGYYRIRGFDARSLDSPTRAARLLYLSRTCFKGMWRHNKKGQFNIGYGGQSRRWVICKEELEEISNLLKRADIRCSDFELVLDQGTTSDFAFLDPPYAPGDTELHNVHYGQTFTLIEQTRLARCLDRASSRGLPWVMTNSAHPDILAMYSGNRIVPMPMGTGPRPGVLTSTAKEVLILNDAATRFLSKVRQLSNLYAIDQR